MALSKRKSEEVLKRRAIFAAGLLLSSSAWAQVRPPGQQVPRANPCPTIRPYPPQLNDLLAQDIGLRPQPGSQWWKDWIKQLLREVNAHKGTAFKKTSRPARCEEGVLLQDIKLFRAGGESISYVVKMNGLRPGISMSVDVTKDGLKFNAWFGGRFDGVLQSASAYAGDIPSARHLRKFEPYDAPFQPREEVVPALRFWTRQYWLGLIELGEAVGITRPSEIKL